MSHRFHLRLTDRDEERLAAIAAALTASAGPGASPWAHPTMTSTLKAAIKLTADAIATGTFSLPDPATVEDALPSDEAPAAVLGDAR